jgi:hypothetical protein
MAPPKLQNDKTFQMRVSAAFLQLLDDWRRLQSPIPSRAQAVRALVESAIKQARARAG